MKILSFVLFWPSFNWIISLSWLELASFRSSPAPHSSDGDVLIRAYYVDTDSSYSMFPC
jgi:hypothetical protein